MVEDAELEWYYRGIGDDCVLIGMGKEPDGPPTDEPNLDFLANVRAAARLRAPALAEFTIRGGSSGIRPLTPDTLPIVGPTSHVIGLIHSCGWGGEGIMHSPAGGKLVATWVHGVHVKDLPAQALLPDRFNNTGRTS
jgi:glycine/D-amino acid oxidase-like deaminating enzyme